MSDVIGWLESPAGEAWSKSKHHCSVNFLAQVKNDYHPYGGFMLWTTYMPWGVVTSAEASRELDSCPA